MWGKWWAFGEAMQLYVSLSPGETRSLLLLSQLVIGKSTHLTTFQILFVFSYSGNLFVLFGRGLEITSLALE